MPSERVRFLAHQGRQVLLIDLTDATVEDVASAIRQARPLVQGAQPASLLTLTDVTNIVVRQVAASSLISFMNDNKPHVKAAAVTGLSELAKAILATMRITTGRKVMAFGTREEALDWLVSVL